MPEIDKARFDELSRGYHDCKTEALVKCDLRLLMYAAIYEEGRPTNGLINVLKPWEVRIWWCLLGSHRDTICGYWCPQVHFESIGKGPEFDWPPNIHPHIPFDCHHHCWEATIHGPRLTPAHCATPYEIVATLLFRTHCDQPAPIVGMCKLPLVTFYEARD